MNPKHSNPTVRIARAPYNFVPLPEKLSRWTMIYQIMIAM